MKWVGITVEGRDRLSAHDGVGFLVIGQLYDATGGAGLAFVLAGILDLIPLGLVLLVARRRAVRSSNAEA